MKAEPNIMKKRLLLIQKLLYEETNEQHPLTTFDILKYLEKQGIVTNRKTLKGDLDLMVECGMDIITVQSKPNRYFWGARKFEDAELKLLIDAVASSKFITRKKSKALIKKIVSLSSKPGQKSIKRNIEAVNRIKSKNESLLYIVDNINDAITQKKQISFQYTDYLPSKKKVLRHDGEIYTLSPYALFWNEDFYYVVGYSNKYQRVSAFRADHICNVQCLEESSVKKPQNFKLEKYSQQIFEMYDGDMVTVKLECANHLMRYVIDRFSENIKTEIATSSTFYAYPEVSLSPNFYSWLFKFAGEIKILSPEIAVEEYISKARAVISGNINSVNRL